MIKKFKNWIKLKFYYFCISKYNFFYKKKTIFNYNFDTLKKKLNGKKILLLGNAEIDYKKINFEKFDVIIRINILPKARKYGISGRTDILMLIGSGGTHWVLEENITKIWLEHSNAFYTNFAKGQLFHYPKKWEYILTKKLNSVPSAGVRCIDFLSRILTNPNISIYGFTFSHKNWYDKKIGQKENSHKHNYKKEKNYFLKIVNKNKNINIFYI